MAKIDLFLHIGQIVSLHNCLKNILSYLAFLTTQQSGGARSHVMCNIHFNFFLTPILETQLMQYDDAHDFGNNRWVAFKGFDRQVQTGSNGIKKSFKF